MSAEILHIIQTHIPNIDQQLTDYIVAVLNSDSYSSAEEVREAVGEVLDSCLNDAFNKSTSAKINIDDICSEFFHILNANNDDSDDDHQKLQQPVNLGSMTSGFDVANDNWQSIWTVSKEMESKVDQKKLQKAEEKLKQKAEKRETNSEERTIPAQNMEASASQMISKKSSKMESAGVNKTKDIKIENFDISFGSQILLQNAQLNLSKICFICENYSLIIINFQVTANGMGCVDETELANRLF